MMSLLEIYLSFVVYKMNNLIHRFLNWGSQNDSWESIEIGSHKTFISI